jgi:hypothetical protein
MFYLSSAQHSIPMVGNSPQNLLRLFFVNKFFNVYVTVTYNGALKSRTIKEAGRWIFQ